QAEDGIRDWSVTGVQTCALPIYAQYAYSDRERDGLIALRQERRPNAKPDDIQRFKGLGEMNYPELWETTMNPGTRTVRQVTLDEIGRAACRERVGVMVVGVWMKR